MLQQDQKSLATKVKNETQSEIATKLLDLKMSSALLNSLNTFFKNKKGRIVTAVVAIIK